MKLSYMVLTKIQKCTLKQQFINKENSNSEGNGRIIMRYDVLNFLLEQINSVESTYLEIGVRNPDDNFNKIVAKKKYSVDPGLEFESNPVDFKMTSDNFFSKLRKSEVLSSTIRFDVIFIDGLHLANQVERDIQNSLEFIKDDGFIVLHDCNPPTEFHARENFSDHNTVAGGAWNGTTWKAFFNIRRSEKLFSCCIDTDWGIGVLSKTLNLGPRTKVKNNFFEYYILDENRIESLNLISFDEFTKIFK